MLVAGAGCRQYRLPCTLWLHELQLSSPADMGSMPYRLLRHAAGRPGVFSDAEGSLTFHSSSSRLNFLQILTTDTAQLAEHRIDGIAESMLPPRK